MTHTNPNITRLEFQHEHDGLTVHARICAISWLAEEHGMQLYISLKPTPQHYEIEALRWPTRFANSSDTDVATHVAEWLQGQTRAQLLARFAAKAALVATLTADEERKEKKRRAMIARRDKTFKAQGRTHKVRGWLHPDYCDAQEVTIYLKARPTTEQARQLMRKRGCLIGNDFVIEAL